MGLRMALALRGSAAFTQNQNIGFDPENSGHTLEGAPCLDKSILREARLGRAWKYA